MGSQDGTTKTAAARLGISLADYTARQLAGEKWCSACRAWHTLDAFGSDKARGSGLSARCLKSRRVSQPRFHFEPVRSGTAWLVEARPGDKRQARRRVNYLVERGLLPNPNTVLCADCGDSGHSGRRHEYDHAWGYDAEHQLRVEVVCSRCHHAREEARRGRAA